MDRNSPGYEKKHVKGAVVSPNQRYTLRKGGETQPVRGGAAGHSPVTGETQERHNQKKSAGGRITKF